MKFNNLKNLTILILTYKRHRELQNKIRYLSKYNYKVLIIDGTPTPFSKRYYKQFKQIEYHHYPTENYHDRIFFSKKYIKTKYVKIESDNDYFVPSAMNKSIHFLEKNNDFSAVIGKCAIYSVFKNQVYIKSLFTKHKSLIDNNPSKRCDDYMQYYSPALYHSVCRSKIFKMNIDFWKKCKKIYKNDFHHFAEICLPLVCLINGKLKCLNHLTWIRADDKIENRLNYIGTKKIMPRPEKHHFYASKLLNMFDSGYFEKFFKLFDKEMIKKNSINFSFMSLKTIYIRYMSKRDLKSKKLLIFSKIIKICTFLIPIYLKKNIRFFLRKNGPTVNEIINKNFEVNYKFSTKELNLINKSIKSL